MPNKENLRKWVAALRSGEYRQGQRYMRRGNEYCCLGVAMELAIAGGVECTPDWGETAHVPHAVDAWYGVLNLNGAVEGGETPPLHAPAYLNDYGFSFADIADRIEVTYGLLED